MIYIKVITYLFVSSLCRKYNIIQFLVSKKCKAFSLSVFTIVKVEIMVSVINMLKSSLSNCLILVFFK